MLLVALLGPWAVAKPAQIDRHPTKEGWKMVTFTSMPAAPGLEKAFDAAATDEENAEALVDLLGRPGRDRTPFAWGANRDPNFEGFTEEEARDQISGLPKIGEVADEIAANWITWKAQWRTAFSSAYDEAHALFNFASNLFNIMDINAVKDIFFQLGTNQVPRARARALAPPPQVADERSPFPVVVPQPARVHQAGLAQGHDG